MIDEQRFLFEDVTVGDRFSAGPYHVKREELLAFNNKWDPLPMHTDIDAARAKGHRDITASGQYTLCVKQIFINQTPWCRGVIGALGFDEVRFPHPVYIDDELSITIDCVDKRASRSKSDRGIVKFSFRLFNQDNVTVLSYIDTVMFERHNASHRS